ncbi:MAG: GNAT family N-acetyltransferase [Dehalococcoidia bacterium]
MTEAWAREGDLLLRAATAADLDSDGVQRALRDNVERNYAGDSPPLPNGLACYAIEAAGTLVGVIGFRRGVPHADAMTVDVLAIAPGERGHAYGTRALLLVEARLARDGVVEGYARVPRGNGHGMYFMLRCGYAPIREGAADDLGGAEDAWGAGVTWFRRNPALAPHGHAPAARGRRSASPSPPR